MRCCMLIKTKTLKIITAISSSSVSLLYSFLQRLIVFIVHRFIAILHCFYYIARFCSMDPPGRPNVFIPSDDGMSDILHSAANAYTMYLDSEGKDDAMSIDPMSKVTPSSLAYTGQNTQRPQLVDFGSLSESTG